MSYLTIQQILETLHIDIQTVRRLEAEGLVEPELGDGGALLYSDEQLPRLRLARDLLELGVNEEGIEVILTMRERMIEMQRTAREALEMMRRAMDDEDGRPEEPRLKSVTVRISSR